MVSNYWMALSTSCLHLLLLWDLAIATQGVVQAHELLLSGVVELVAAVGQAPHMVCVVQELLMSLLGCQLLRLLVALHEMLELAVDLGLILRLVGLLL